VILDSSLIRWLLLGGIILLIVAFWAAQRSNKHPFDLRDTLMDASTGKASLNACVLVLFAFISAWVIIDRENDGKDDVGGILAMVLGIFVAGRVVAQGIAAYRPIEPGATVEQTTVRKETTVTADPKP
jgi:drug/metabolite transporter (DMT)-like permease